MLENKKYTVYFLGWLESHLIGLTFGCRILISQLGFNLRKGKIISKKNISVLDELWTTTCGYNELIFQILIITSYNLFFPRRRILNSKTSVEKLNIYKKKNSVK